MTAPHRTTRPPIRLRPSLPSPQHPKPNPSCRPFSSSHMSPEIRPKTPHLRVDRTWEMTVAVARCRVTRAMQPRPRNYHTPTPFRARRERDYLLRISSGTVTRRSRHSLCTNRRKSRLDGSRAVRLICSPRIGGRGNAQRARLLHVPTPHRNKTELRASSARTVHLQPPRKHQRQTQRETCGSDMPTADRAAKL